MVEAGEIIDNVVLNCVISGLLRCGEESSAERLYGKMKASPMRISPMPESNYFANKVVTKVLMMFAKVGKRHPKMVSTFQALARTSPDLQTYRLLVSHHAEKTGDIHKVAQLLNEMNWFAIPVHGAIFLSLFKGFDQHGGYSGSDWTEQRLEGVFQSLIQAIDEGTEGLTLERWLVTKALAAFAKCSTEDRVLYAYAALRARWALKEQDEEYVSRFLYKLIGKEYAHKSVDSNFAR